MRPWVGIEKRQGQGSECDAMSRQGREPHRLTFYLLIKTELNRYSLIQLRRD